MTRDQLVEIMNDEINASEFRVSSDVIGRCAVAILAEMAEAADLLTTQAAEIERLKARCENLRSAMNSDPDVIALRTRQEELEAALRLALDSLEYIQQSHPECTGIAARVEAIKVSHTALAPAGKEVKP